MPAVQLNDRELEFLRLIVEDIPYHEIADRMYLSRRTIDGYRDVLFAKTKAKSRTGLIRFSIYNGIGKMPVGPQFSELSQNIPYLL